MKKITLPLLLICISLLSFAGSANLFECNEVLTSSSKREIILRAQLAHTGIRRMTQSDIIGVKDNELSTVVVEFRHAGEFITTITNDSEQCLERHIMSSDDGEMKSINISTLGWEQGQYTLTVEVIESGQTFSGIFTVK